MAGDGGISRAPLFAALGAAGVAAGGSAMTMIAVPWFVLATTGSGTSTGLVAAAEALGLLVSVALIGPLVDRCGPRRISVLADLLTAPVVAAIPLAYATTGLPVGALTVMAFGIGLGRAPARSAKQVLLPDTVARAGVRVERATGALEAVHRLGDVLGAPVGGTLIAVFGASHVLLLDAVALLVAAALVVLFVPATRPGTDPATGTRGYLADLAEGARYLCADHLLLAMAVLCAAANALFVGLFSVLVPAYGAIVWQDSMLVGVVIAAVGAGGLFGAVLYGWLGARVGRRTTFTWSFLLWGPPTYLVLAANPPAIVLVALLTLVSFGSGPLNPVVAGLKYDRVPVRLRGRVFGALYTVTIGAMPLGTLLAGLLLDVIGVRPAVLVLGGLCLAVTACPLMFRIWRELDAPPRAALTGAAG